VYIAIKFGGLIDYPLLSSNSSDGVRPMVFNATFNNVSGISWWSVLLVRKPEYPEEHSRPAASQWQTLPQHAISSTPRHERDSNSQL